MYPTLKNELRTIRTALWFRPSAYCLVAVLIAIFVASIDDFVPPQVLSWLPAVEIAAVKDLLRLLAGSMLTVTTVTLSVIMLVFSLATNQASPRAIPEMMADRVTQNALGTFLAAFVFSLTGLLLFGVGAVTRSGATLNFILALLLVIASVRYLLQWIHHVADTLKLNRIIERVHKQAQTALDSFFSKYSEEPRHVAPPEAGAQSVVLPKASGYVQLIDEKRLRKLVNEREVAARLCVHEGDFVHPARPLMKVATTSPDDELVSQLRASVVVGFERSPEGDPRFSFELLAEIACRALSPGINDPQSALSCINYLGDLLVRAATVPPFKYPPTCFEDGWVTFIRPDFESLLERSFRPVIRDGAASAEIIFAILGAMVELARKAEPEYLTLIVRESERAVGYGEASLTLAVDKADLADIAKELKEVVASRQRQLAG